MELIRKSDALNAVLHHQGDAAVAAVENIKAVDAVPVVHGEWSNRRTWTHDGEWYCTACDREITIYMGEKRGNDRYKYCPNCGAMMKGEENER